MITRVILVIGIVLFLLFAAVQFNDPDPYIWVMAYLAAALVTVPFLLRRYSAVPLLLAVIYLVWFATLAGTIDANWIDVEEAREAFGLLICLLWMIFLGILWWKDRQSGDES